MFQLWVDQWVSSPWPLADRRRLGGSYFRGAQAAEPLSRTGDLLPQRVQYQLLTSWAGALLLPQVNCVQVHWTGSPPPAGVVPGRGVYLGTSSDVAVLYDLQQRHAVRLHTGSIALVSLPDNGCLLKSAG